jgi:transcriptional regulator with XRE-family HTH domain
MTVNKLLVRRAELRITQSKTARAAGMGRYRYWQIENQDGAPATAEERKAIAKALKTSVAELFSDMVTA